MPCGMVYSRVLPLVLAHASLAHAAAPEPEMSCPAGAEECARPERKGQYYWSHQKGDVNRTGLSPHAAPRDLQRGPTWRWVDPHVDVISQSPLIDDRLNIYINTRGGRVYKFSPDGDLLWMFRTSRGSIGTVPAIMDGRLYGNTRSGYVFALDMETGTLMWEVLVAPDNATGGDSACLLAVNGTVVSAAEAPDATGGNAAVIALDTEGRRRWTYRLQGFKVYNFQASSPGDGTILFQDAAGGVYRVRLDSGELLWQSGIKDRLPSYFTTGAAVVGPNGVVYAASNTITTGIIHAYRLDDGSLIWRRDIEFLANQAVAVGPIAGSGGRLAVVAGVGENPGLAPIVGLTSVSMPLACACTLLHVLLRQICGRCCGCCLRLSWALPMLVPLGVIAYMYVTDTSGNEMQIVKPFVVNAMKFAVLLLLFLQMLLKWRWWFKGPWRPLRLVLLAAVAAGGVWGIVLAIHNLSLLCKGWPEWFWLTKELPSRLMAFDAESGRTLWEFSPPLFRRSSCTGDEELYLTRMRNLAKDNVGDPICLPDSWSQSVIDSRGTSFVGFMDGHLYAVRDEDGDGKIAPSEAVSIDFGNAFQGTQAIAPGMLVVVPCGGGMHVWKE